MKPFGLLWHFEPYDDFRTRRYHSHSSRTCLAVYPFSTIRATKSACLFASSALALALNEITGSRSSTCEKMRFSMTSRIFS